MPATFGITSTFGGTEPSGGFVQESSEEKSCEVATIKDEFGKTVVAQPKGVLTTTVTIRSKGEVQVSSLPTIGSIGGALKVTSAKISESNDDFRTAEITCVKYETL